MKAVLDVVTGFYIESRDFNGIRLDALTRETTKSLSWTPERVVDTVAELVTGEKASLRFASVDVNPHIMRFRALPVQEQVQRLRQECASTVCVYPTETVIRATADPTLYDDKPFTKRLLLGEPQLTPAYFDLRVLDIYHSDPRYTYSFSDYNGSISVSDQYFESGQMPERDQTLLQTFGIGYDSDRNRVVVVFLRYLSDLSPEHQRIWQAHIRTDECKMVYEYYQNDILGEFAECMSTYEAILEEQKILNELASTIGRSPLFRQTYPHRPRGFSLLLRPTRNAYTQFVHLLDKMLSENMDKAFFGTDVPLQEESTRKDGRVEVTQKGTLRLLDEWLHKTVRFPSEEPYTSIVEPLREVRRLRQRPAHALEEDNYDMAYARKQDDLVLRVHHALLGLCIVLSTHPKTVAAGYKLPDWLVQNKVKSY